MPVDRDFSIVEAISVRQAPAALESRLMGGVVQRGRLSSVALWVSAACGSVEPIGPDPWGTSTIGGSGIATSSESGIETSASESGTSDTSTSGTGTGTGTDSGSGSGSGSDSDSSGCPIGAAGCPCTAGGGCDRGLHCSSDACVPDEPCPPAMIGTEGCQCTPGGGCDPGLECISQICVDPG
jgi:hypothetical protein